jgi:glutathione synthase/RimK-type ligase-like ATP-grasp enzyme
MKIYPYNSFSASAKALAKHLNIKRIRHIGDRTVFDNVVINWGSSSFKRRIHCNYVLNKPYCVAKAANKLETFNALKGRVDIPEYTKSKEEASKWLAEDVIIVERHKLTGHSGEGIRLVHHDDKENYLSDDAKLYVKYIAKTHEYRIHVFRDKVFFVQRKARSKEIPDDKVNWQVRNHGNGFIYAHQDIDVPDEAKQAAIMAVNCLGLDFGAVDMIFNKKRNKYYVLEINTACGLYGETLNKYGEIFQQFK